MWIGSDNGTSHGRAGNDGLPCQWMGQRGPFKLPFYQEFHQTEPYAHVPGRRPCKEVGNRVLSQKFVNGEPLAITWSVHLWPFLSAVSSRDQVVEEAIEGQGNWRNYAFSNEIEHSSCWVQQPHSKRFDGMKSVICPLVSVCMPVWPTRNSNWTLSNLNTIAISEDD